MAVKSFHCARRLLRSQDLVQRRTVYPAENFEMYRIFRSLYLLTGRRWQVICAPTCTPVSPNGYTRNTLHVYAIMLTFLVPRITGRTLHRGGKVTHTTPHLREFSNLSLRPHHHGPRTTVASTGQSRGAPTRRPVRSETRQKCNPLAKWRGCPGANAGPLRA